jgi:hypothetical protein
VPARSVPDMTPASALHLHPERFERLMRGWRAHCPDISEREVALLVDVRLNGPTAQTALAAFRAGVEEGQRRAAAGM